MDHILIRADAGPGIGLGHGMRCLALAQALKYAGATAVFATRPAPAALLDRLHAENIQVVPITSEPGSLDDAVTTANEARKLCAKWIVADGYAFSPEYHKSLKTTDARLLQIDDLGSGGHYYADLVLNQNLHASASLYEDREPGTKLLLGTGYALLRREFLDRQPWEREIPPVARRLLVTTGGEDQDNVTAKVRQALRLVPPHIVVRDGESNMAEAMAWADVAVSAAGSTCWELAFMRLPSIVIPVAPNQLPVAEAVARAGAAVNLGWHADVSPQRIAAAIDTLASSPDLRSSMAACGRSLVDGRGAERVAGLLLARPLTLRRASPHDAELLWNWRNDSLVREHSFSSDPIPWRNHLEWLESRLHDHSCYIFIGLDEEHHPVGQVRVEIGMVGAAEAHISVDRCMRGRGYGSAMLIAVCQELQRLQVANTIHASIKPTNNASLRMFQKAGFVETCHSDHDARHYVCHI